MRIVVMKFGGTSVASPESRVKIIEKVQAALRRGDSPVLVVSAMGRLPEPYATDTLLSLVRDYPQHRHLGELDQLMACGETISAVLLAHVLRANAVASRAFDGRQAGFSTTDEPGNAKILAIDTTRLMSFISTGGVPVVTGFQGVDSKGDITTLGRGGSDTSAVALGAALRAHYVEIYTDVDGVMTADPRVYSEAEILQQINFEEIGELASEGAKVVHPRAVEMADEHGVPVWVKNTMNDRAGTYMARAVPRQAYERDRVITGIAHMLGMVRVSLVVTERAAQASVLQRLAREGVNLDLITISPAGLVVVLPGEMFRQRAESSLQALGIPYEVTENCAKLSLVGAGVPRMPGVMAQIMTCLDQADVTILHSSDSNITISLLVEESSLPAAVQALHRHFLSSRAAAH
jgi:aspartate kinase